MTERLLLHLNVVKQYAKEKLSKYDKIECPRLGKVQLSPFVKKPLTFEFKVYCELSSRGRSRLSELPVLHHVAEHSHPKRTSRLGHASLALVRRKTHIGKTIVKPSRAPNNLKTKPSFQKGYLQHLDGNFVILKLTPKLKPIGIKTEIQKRPERDEDKMLGRTDASHSGSTAGVTIWEGLATVTLRKAGTPEQSSCRAESKHEVNQNLERENKGKEHLLLDTRKDIHLVLNNKAECIKSCIHTKDAGLKEKKGVLPLSIEDEIEKPNAKVIRTDCPKATPNAEKMSETYPVFCHNEEYMQKHILDRWLGLYRDKGFHDTSKRDEAYKLLKNPALATKCKNSVAIIEGNKYGLPNGMAKRKKKTPLSAKRRTVNLQILSVWSEYYIPILFQEKGQLVQKIDRNITNDNAHDRIQKIIESSISHSTPTYIKDDIAVHGVNPKSDIGHERSSRCMTAVKKSQIPRYGGKSIATFEEAPKKSRLICVDYIAISKPVQMHTYRAHSPFRLARNPSKVPEYDKTESATKLGGIEFSEQRNLSPLPGDTAGLSSEIKCPQTELNNSLLSQKEELATQSEEPHVIFSWPLIINIPTAQCDASDGSRDLRMQKTTDI